MTDEDPDFERARRVFAAIPPAPPRKHVRGQGSSGQTKCPNCPDGILHWRRSSYNGHLAASCTTPDCFAMIQ